MNLSDVFGPGTWRETAGHNLVTYDVVHPESGEPFSLYDVRGLFPDQDENWKRALSDVTGFAVHHDAVAFSGEDRNFNGHTFDESITRLGAIYNFHVDAGWNGIGYHVVIDLEGRMFTARPDVLDTHRAHVSTNASSGQRNNPAPGAPTWNRQLIGVCFMGHYSDGKLPDGRTVGPLNDRPTTHQLQALDAFCRLTTNALAKPMTLRPHKYYQVKECPGSWVTEDAWGDVYTPEAVPEPEPPVNVAAAVHRLTVAKQAAQAGIDAIDDALVILRA